MDKHDKRLVALLDLANRLAPKSRKDIALAFEDPAAYVKRYAKRLRERGIEEPTPDLPWIALIDAAIAAKRCFGIDWKTDVEDFVGALDEIGVRVSFDGVDNLDNRSTWELLELAGKQLLGKGKQLCSIDDESDEYNLICVATKNALGLVRLAKATRLGRIELFAGKQLGAATKERIARMKRYEREAAREAKRKPPKMRFFAKGKEVRVIQTHVTAFDTEFERPGEKWYVHHYFKKAADTKPRAANEVAAWQAEGFRVITRAEFDAFPHAEGAYIKGYSRPMRADAVYKKDGRVIACIERVPDGVLLTKGVIGYDFGTLANVQHDADFDQQVAAQPGKPITLAEARKFMKQRK